MSSKPSKGQATFWLMVSLVVLLASLAAQLYGLWDWAFNGGGTIFEADGSVGRMGWLVWLGWAVSQKWERVVEPFDFEQSNPRPYGSG